MFPQENKAKNIVKKADKPVSIQKIADELDISWGAARAMLLSLALEGKIKGLKTDRGWVFFEGNVRLM